MKRVFLGALSRLIPLALVALFLAGSSRPVEAANCVTNLANCYYSAAAISSFWWRWAAGLDCELAFVECTREAIMG